MKKSYFDKEIKTITDLFHVGMDREIPKLAKAPLGRVINLGAGTRKVIVGAMNLDLPKWNAEFDKLPFARSSVAVVHCHHLLEHVQNIEFLMSEISRVLKPKGVVYITVPAYPSELAFEDPSHVRFFTVESMKNLLENSYYKRKKLNLEIVMSILMGVTGRNLCILYQLRRKVV